MHSLKPKEPLIAIMLSVILAGLGQVYAGRLKRGVIFFFIPVLYAVVMFSYLFNPAAKVKIDFSHPFIIFVFFGVYFSLDAYLCAKSYNIKHNLKCNTSVSMKTLIIINTLLLIFILNPFNIFVYYVRNNIVQCLNIQEDSMAPALMKGDKILINRSIYRKSEPKRGDIVFFKTASHKLISRLIGLPKDTVEIRNGTLLVNAAVVKKGFPKENMTLKVPEDSYFVSKDNYLLPSDTRLTETISKRYLKGKVYKIYYPFHRSGPVR